MTARRKSSRAPKAIEVVEVLQVREQHLDLLTLTPQPDVGIDLRDVACNVSSLFVIERGTLRAGISIQPAKTAKATRTLKSVSN